MNPWHSKTELPPHATKTTSITVIVRKKTGRTARAYYLYPRNKWIMAQNGEEIPAGEIAEWKESDKNYLEESQRREDDEQAAYLAEWNRRHQKHGRTGNEKKKGKTAEI